MRLQLAILFVLALTAQLVNAAWHGFALVEDGLQAIEGRNQQPRGGLRIAPQS